MRVKLTFVNGPRQRTTVRITKPRKYVVGSGSGVQLRLSPANASVSQRHFAIEVRPSGCSITDLASATGTYVNGRKVEQAELRDGDIVRVGTIEILVRVQNAVRFPATAEILDLEQIVAERQAGRRGAPAPHLRQRPVPHANSPVPDLAER